MKWEGGRESENVEDRRGGGGMPFGIGGGRGLSIGGVIVALIVAWIFGINPLTVLNLMSGGGGAPAVQQPAGPAATDAESRFVRVILGSTEDVWTALFRTAGREYQAPRLVLFRGVTPTACGHGQSAMGPFYCPGDKQVYIDLEFFETLKRQLGAPGDFAQAYVIAHEVGHHVQNELGLSAKVDAARQRMSEADGNALSVRVELQADCFAGVWGHHTQQRLPLEQGDLEEALNAASRIGDDALQRRSQGTVVPESFTHGSSAQRVQWFRRGFESGRVDSCNTFEGGKP
ncbi:KPN_02809 family neutral zinc metallopeptidase [Caldimonas sp. KR1-144]|uniref:KPN_02809 family neutral zinc metallopeptidase n=1 Tax=Caldimonas sp. KR1-144 TaxID=3400911 RepID=UPI003C0BA89E